MAPLFLIQRFPSIILTLNSLEMKRYLEYLDVFDGFLESTPPVYAGPLINNTCYVFQRKSGECQIMTWMENENIARANHGLAGKQWVWRGMLNGVRRGKDRRIIVRKDLGMLIRSILLTVGALVSRAKVTIWIMFRQGS